MAKVHASLFSGFGAPDLAATWMGWDNAFWCEIDDFPRTVLSYWFPKSKGYGNIKETDFTPWHGKIDVLTGGFPCQPFSVAGQRKGQEDDRYLWPEMLRAIREIRPTWVIGENVGGIISMVQPGSEVTVESQASLFKASDKETLLEQEYVVETVCRIVGTESSLLPTVQTQGLKVCNEKGKTEFIDLKSLPTPNARKEDKYSKKYNPNSQMGTASTVLFMNEMLPTPIANSWKTPCEHGTGSPNLQTYIARELGPTSRLNPLFVEEMMGFPLMWCVLPFLSQRGVPDQSKDTVTR